MIFYDFLWFSLLSFSDPLYSFHAYCSVEVHPWPQSLRDAPHPRLQFLRVVCTLVWWSQKWSSWWPQKCLLPCSSPMLPPASVFPCVSCSVVAAFFLHLSRDTKYFFDMEVLVGICSHQFQCWIDPACPGQLMAYSNAGPPWSPLTSKCSELCSVHQVCD